MNKYINLTPHRITIRRDDGTDVVIPPDGEIMRVDTTSAEQAQTPDGIRINEIRPTDDALRSAVRKVRERMDGEAIVIVSGIALDWLGPLLSDEEIYRVLSPDTSPGSAIRETSGRVTAVRALRMAV